MNLSAEQIQALYKLYPQIVTVRGDAAYDADGNEVAYDLTAVTTQAQKDACKAQAKSLLAASDWSVLPDVGLTNKADFESYRATLRNLALNPVENPTFPTEPTPVWG
jgi:hypothetical protein